MKYTIGQAAKATGRSKSLISKAIKDGKISATRTGSLKTSPMQIEASELFRVYSPVNTTKNKPEHIEKTLKTPRGSSENSNVLELATALEIVKAKNEYQQQRIADLEGMLSETKQQADEYRTELKSAETKLIGVLETLQVKPKAEPPKRGLLQRILGSS